MTVTAVESTYYASKAGVPCPPLVRRVDDWWERYEYHNAAWVPASFELVALVVNTGDWSPVHDDVAAAMIDAFATYGYGPGPLIGGPTFSTLKPR